MVPKKKKFPSSSFGLILSHLIQDYRLLHYHNLFMWISGVIWFFFFFLRKRKDEQTKQSTISEELPLFLISQTPYLILIYFNFYFIHNIFNLWHNLIFSLFVFSLQTKEYLEGLVDKLNADRPVCPVGLNTLVIPRRSGMEHNLQQPYVYLSCGHVQGHHDWGLNKDSNFRTCPMCLKVSNRIQGLMNLLNI